MNHLPAQLKSYMMWGMPIMLCLINEALYACQQMTPPQTDNDIQVFPASVKWELGDGLHGLAHIWDEMFRCREEIVFKKQMRCYVETFHENKSLIDDTDRGWQWMTQQCSIKTSNRNLLETAASAPRNQTNRPEWKLASTVNSSIKSIAFD